MNAQLPRRITRLRLLPQLFVALFAAHAAFAQISPAEHAAHHPGQAGAAMSSGTNATGAAGMGGMMEGMGEMMKGMGKPPPKELYPSLMALPELTPEQRKLVEAQAAERMHAGTILMGQALDALNTGARSENYAAMHEATTLLREGLAQFDSGVAARRALAEGKAPRSVALAWFKSEMSLASPVLGEERRSHLGLSFFHLLTMAMLIAFAFAMLAMYFFKMRRAAALFGRLESDGGSPPPGSAPPLGGTDGPLASPGEKASPEKSPSPASTNQKGKEN